ncbi:penicillin-binding protein [Streptomyces tsukubensis]|nr:penicillin-binding protein [Streptomyces tsukubensis]
MGGAAARRARRGDDDDWPASDSPADSPGETGSAGQKKKPGPAGPGNSATAATAATGAATSGPAASGTPASGTGPAGPGTTRGGKKKPYGTPSWGPDAATTGTPQAARTAQGSDTTPAAGTAAGASVGAAHAAGSPPPGGPTGGDGRGDGNGNGEGKSKKAKKSRKRKGWRRIFPTWRMVLGGFLLIVLILVGGFVAGYVYVDIPKANGTAVAQANIFQYADGSQIASDGEVNRENVKLSVIPKTVQHTALAAEDRDFYTESAVDPAAMVRAAWNTVRGKGKQSGSTITQQYVKNYYLGQEQTVTRKAKEFFISIKLDREKSKDEILEGYLNTSYFGRNAYGIQAAAQAYYGVDVGELDVSQGAYLAALVNAPSAYDVVAHPENKQQALGRWKYVLDGMVKEGWLSRSERARAKFEEPIQAHVPSSLSGQRGYLVEAVKNYLTENHIVDEDDLHGGGYRITTTFRKPRQEAFEKAVNDKLMSKLDKKNRAIDKSVRAGGVSIDPKTGKVVAMYGGIDYTQQFVNNATRRDFQVGSTFKPFVFASAVQNGSTTQDGRPINPNTMYDGTNKRPVQGWKGGAYGPENEDNRSYGQITTREATDKSVNAVYAQMAVDVGPTKVKKTAVSLGLPAATPDLQPYPSIALGPANASVLDMTQAYATLANHGKHGSYTLVDRVTKGGEQLDLPKQEVRQAITKEAADTTTSVLQSVVDGGTGTAALAAGRPAAGKTGTAEEDTAAWFAGYTPDLATVVSVMGQDPVTAKHKSLYGATGLARINGGGAPAEIWAQFTKASLKGSKAKKFDLDLAKGAASKAPSTSQAPPPQTPGTTGTTGDQPPPETGTGGGDQNTGGQQGGTGPTGGTDTTGGGDPGGGDTTGTPGGGAVGGGTSDGGTGTPGGGNTGSGGETGGTPGGSSDGGTDPSGGGDPGGGMTGDPGGLIGG